MVSHSRDTWKPDHFLDLLKQTRYCIFQFDWNRNSHACSKLHYYADYDYADP